jgi:hypothetical protein
MSEEAPGKWRLTVIVRAAQAPGRGQCQSREVALLRPRSDTMHCQKIPPGGQTTLTMPHMFDILTSLVKDATGWPAAQRQWGLSTSQLSPICATNSTMCPPCGLEIARGTTVSRCILLHQGSARSQSSTLLLHGLYHPALHVLYGKAEIEKKNGIVS